MANQDILNAEQRRDVVAFTGAADADTLDDEALITLAAEQIGMEGELAVDAGGMVELSRDNLLVILESVEDDDAQYVEHPDQLHLAVYLRPESDADRQRLEDADLIEKSDEPDALEADGWTYAWWGAMCTRLSKETDLPTQMETLHRVLGEAEAAVAAASPDRFFEATKWLEHDAE
ncbi:MAG TPA: hypothetical protein VK939_01790 [Longimicrobiales bacterium]|nr:hypothetical protein [Longimicrobiales bacterium]